MSKIFKAALGLILFSCFYAAALVLVGIHDDASISDVAIVPGSKVELNGQPSARLAARLDQGALMLSQGLARHLIVSGGVGIEGFDEAQVMRDYLVRKGVPASQIVVDSLGLTTEATAVNSAAIMRARGWTSAIVVTQYFHVPRTALALRRAGISKVTSSHARYAELRDVYSLTREMIALPTYWIFHH